MINKNESKTVMGPMDILINHFCFWFFFTFSTNYFIPILLMLSA